MEHDVDLRRPVGRRPHQTSAQSADGVHLLGRALLRSLEQSGCAPDLVVAGAAGAPVADDAMLQRCSDLALEGALVVVLAVADTRVPGGVVVPLSPRDPLARERLLVALAGDRGVALSASEVVPGRWTARWTADPFHAVAEARRVLGLVQQALPTHVLATAVDALERRGRVLAEA